MLYPAVIPTATGTRDYAPRGVAKGRLTFPLRRGHVGGWHHRLREGEQVIETELKISLDEAGEAAIDAHDALERMRALPRQTEDLVSTDFVSRDQALAKAGLPVPMPGPK